MYVTEATTEHCYALEQRLRIADIQEIVAASGKEPIEALLLGLENSDPCISIMDGDRVMGMYGVVPVDNRIGGVWLLGSNELVTKPYSTEFVRKCREYANDLYLMYDVMGNWVDERNRTHIRWLKWMGAIFIGRDEKHGVAEIPFLEFVLVKGN